WRHKSNRRPDDDSVFRDRAPGFAPEDLKEYEKLSRRLDAKESLTPEELARYKQWWDARVQKIRQVAVSTEVFTDAEQTKLDSYGGIEFNPGTINGKKFIKKGAPTRIRLVLAEKVPVVAHFLFDDVFGVEKK